MPLRLTEPAATAPAWCCCGGLGCDPARRNVRNDEPPALIAETEPIVRRWVEKSAELAAVLGEHGLAGASILLITLSYVATRFFVLFGV